MSISPKLIGLVILMCAAAVAVSAADTQPVQTVKDLYPRLPTGALLYARLKDLPAGVVLESGGVKITPNDLNERIREAPKELWPQMKRNLFFVLEDVASKTFLTYEANEWAKRNQQAASAAGNDIVAAYLISVAGELSVSDDEAKSYFDANKDATGEAAFDQVKDQLKQFLLDQKRQDAIKVYVAGTGQRYEINVNETWVAKQNSAAMDNPVDKARKSGKPTMIDFGADGCKPCDMMAPLLASLQTDYAGKANVLFVHVRKEQVLGARYGIEVIPVQVFFDKDGKEVFRHAGFYPKDQIVAKLVEMGVK